MIERVALVAGGSGVVGRRLAEHLAAEPGWRVLAIARRATAQPAGCELLSIDLMDSVAVSAAADRLAGVTHLFYCARFPHRAGEPEPVEANLAMLSNLVAAVEPLAPGLEHVHLVHG